MDDLNSCRMGGRSAALFVARLEAGAVATCEASRFATGHDPDPSFADALQVKLVLDG